MNVNLILAGAMGGFVTALVVDVNAYQKWAKENKGKYGFDWSLAFKRWLSGAAIGAANAAGWQIDVRF